MKTTLLFLLILLFVNISFSQSFHPTGLKQKNLRDYSFVKKSDISVKSNLPLIIDHSANMPPVGNQGQYGSCVGWAAGYYYKTYQEYEDYGWNVNETNHIFSASFVYNHINGGGDYGANFEDAFKLLMDNGCATINEFPYQNYTNWPSENTYFNALKYRSDEFFYINTENTTGIQQLKQHIAAGHCAVLGIAVYPNFDNIQQYNYTYCSADVSGALRGYHAVTIVGYDDTRITSDGTGAFKLVNSWGKGWGQSGYFWMSYTAVMDAVISGQQGYYTTDKLHYNPELIAVARLTHSSKFKVQIKLAIGANCSPLWTKKFFNFDMGCNADVPFPNNSIVFDITDGASFIYPYTDNRIYMVCRDTISDGRSGMLDSLKAKYLTWCMTSYSTETPAKIYDSVLTTFAGLVMGPNVSTNVGVQSIDLIDYMVPGTVVPKATVRNYGTIAQSFPVTFQVSQNSGEKSSIIYTSTKNVTSLQPYTAVQISFDNWNASNGNYTITAFTKLPYDSLQINDTLVKSIGVMNLPTTPVLLTPSSNSTGLDLNVQFKWNKINNILRYNFKLALDSLFTNIYYSDSLSSDTSRTLLLNPLTKYYWKAGAINLVGAGEFSEARSFKTKGAPNEPNRVLPLNNANNLLKPVVFKWNKASEQTYSPIIEKYMLEIASDTNNTANYLIRVPTDTVWVEDSLGYSASYYWRIRAKSSIGWGIKTSWWKFTTTSNISRINDIIPDKFCLFNNYPNPFNPVTKINFDIPQNSEVVLKVFDISGREISVLVNEKLNAGKYSINFNAGNFASGVYFYRMSAGNFSSTKKMILLK